LEVEQGGGALEAGLGGGTEPAEVTDALKAAGQNMLQETVEETLGSEGGGLALALVVGEGKGDGVAVVGEDFLGAEGGAIDVSGQVFQSGFTGTDALDIGDPVERPDLGRDLAIEFGMVLLEGGFETGAQAQGQDAFGQEVIGVRGSNPAQAVIGESAARDDTMNVGMEAQVAGPGLEDSQQGQVSAEIFVVAAEVEERAGALPQQEGVEDFLVGTEEGAELFGDGEGDQVIGNGQEAAALVLQPLGGVGMAATGAGAVIAGVVGIFPTSTITSEKVAAQGRGAAGKDGLDGAPVRRQEAGAKLSPVRRPMAAQDLGQRNQERSPAVKVSKADKGPEERLGFWLR
jgi:hypothetical protein